MKNGLLFLLIILHLPQSWANGQFQLTDSIQIDKIQNVTDFSVDDFNNIYFINNFTELNKVEFHTKKIKTFSNHSILENLDAQNVFQITMKMAFFNLLILDNQLNPVQDPIEFPAAYDFSPTLIALVDNNYLWGYDPILQRLILWNYQDKKMFRQSVIINEKSGDEFYTDLRYDRDKIYLIGRQKILVFDELANLKEVIPFQEYDEIQMLKNNLYFTLENQLFQFNLKTKQKNPIELNRSFTNFAVNNQHLFVLDKKVVYIYKSLKE